MTQNLCHSLPACPTSGRLYCTCLPPCACSFTDFSCIMFALPHTSLSLSFLTKAWRLKWPQHLGPCCCFSTLILDTHRPAYLALRVACLTTSTKQLQPRCRSKRWSPINVLAKKFTTQTPSTKAAASCSSLQLKGREVQIPLLWLRDHCRCQACYNADTCQKNVDDYSLKNLAVHQSGVEGDTLSVTWQDGHVSQYSVQWLENSFHTSGSLVDRFLWDGPGMRSEQLPVTTFDAHMNTEDGLKNTLSKIVKYGFCVVDGAPPTTEGTELVTGRISFPLETVFGRVSVMESEDLIHSDTAYTSVALGAHNDTTYFTVPAGLQVFHCLHHEGQGGETLLVDGFHAAEELRRTNPNSFDCLVKTIVPHEYIEGSHYHLYSLGTVLSVDHLSGQLTHIRFNPYDRAPLRTVAAEDIDHFYKSYEALAQIIRSKDSEFYLKLKPGMVLLVDNWRVMHGRSRFTGRRVLCGVYLPRDDWTSRARVLGLM